MIPNAVAFGEQLMVNGARDQHASLLDATVDRVGRSTQRALESPRSLTFGVVGTGNSARPRNRAALL